MDSSEHIEKINNVLNYNVLHGGRRKIILNYSEVTPDNVMEVFQKAIAIHDCNKADCEYLIGVFLGKQDILFKSAGATSEINNQIVANFAFPITRQIVGYTYGNPVEYVAKDINKQESATKINDLLNYESNFTVDICSQIFSSICGVGYQITLPSSEISQDFTPDVPIVVDYLDPRNTFVVQSTDVGNPQIMSCMEAVDSNGETISWTMFTNKYKFIYSTITNELKVMNNPIGLDPITMYENSLFLTGDWEEALSVMNALNLVLSDSVDDIEGTIKSLLVLIGCDLEDAEETIKSIKKKRLLSIAGGTESVSGNLDAKFIAPKLDSNSTERITKFLEDARNVITGIPDRSANSNGGDTGQAVVTRDGWTDIEIVAKLKELFFKKAKQRQLSVVIAILKKLNLLTGDINSLDITVNIGRHTTDNLGTKASAFATLVGTGRIATVDALSMSGLTNRVNEVVERGKVEEEEREQKALEMAQASGQNEDNKENVDKNNGNSEEDKK